VQQDSYAAVAHFNDGNIAFIDVLKQLEINPGYHTTNCFV